jgi:Asp-tRNA(Asn)/Glu-tRNA(Gln) amidotransferase A subunit family amidase
VTPANGADEPVSATSIPSEVPGAPAAAQTSPAPSDAKAALRFFTEIADNIADPSSSLNVPSNDVVSGVTVAVVDCLDVSGLSTRFGLPSSSLIRHVARPDTEFPFVSWLRTHGAHVIGKLACHSPLCLEEAAAITPLNSAAIAVSSGACDIAITSSIIGPAGLTNSVFCDVCAFKPTAGTFPAPRGSAPFRTESQSVALVGRHFDDLLYVWQAYTGEFKASMIAQPRRGADLGGALSSSGGGVMLDSALGSCPIPRSPSPSADAPYASDLTSGGISASFWRFLTRQRANQKRKKRQPRDDFVIDLTVGFPAKWIDKLMGDRMTASSFAYQLHQMREKHRPLLRKDLDSASTNLRIRPIEFDSIDLDQVLRNVNTIAYYELATAFDRHVDAYVRGMSDVGVQSSASSLQEPAASSPSSAFLDDLPPHVAAAIYDGRRLTSWDYNRALQGRLRIVSYIEELFRDVDVICSPILAHPFQDGNSRSIITSLPFAMVGSPTASAYLSEDLSVQLVGELGRDSGLLDDATAFLSFVKGSSPGWFRRKFLNET